MIGRVRNGLAALLLLAVAFASQTAWADEAVRASCHAETNLVRGIDHPVLPPPESWDCDQSRFAAAPPVAWVYFTPSDMAANDVSPTHFVTNVDRFARITLIAMGAEGPIRSRSYGMEDVSSFVNGPNFALPLPDMTRATGLVVAIERPWAPVLASEARLQARHGSANALGWTSDAMLTIAILLGLLIAPMLYHALLYRILREQFVLWHLGMVGSIIGFVLVWSGLIHHYVQISLSLTAFLMALTGALPIAFAMGFCLTYVERAALSDRVRKFAIGGQVTLFGVLGFLILPLSFLRPIANNLATAMFIPIIAIFAAVSIAAIRSGSRAIWIQIASWTPALVIGIEMNLRRLGLYSVSDEVERFIFYGFALQILISSAAVIQRMDLMRRDRDRVNARLDALTNLIDLDPLTGIFNRRALEQRFAELRSDGFHALAVVDLDHFKRINDRFGHTMGDRVLQEVASVLAGDKDAIAFRMGGEEFVVMLRGGQVQQRAEQMRRAITIRIANEIEGIDAPVTASMGLIESPPGGALTMRQLYSHADRLLYEAKYSGRNRLISERIQLFDAPARDRRLRDRRKTERRDETEDAA